MYCNNLKHLPQIMNFIEKQAKEILCFSNKGVDIEVKKHTTKRSNAQNNYYFLICGEVAKFLNEAGLSYGELDYSSEIIHLINKKKNGINTTTKLSIGEFCDYMTKVILFWQEKTSFEWMPSELPVIYMENRGYIETQEK